MSKSKVFVDTSGFYALLAQQDPAHKRAAEYVDEWRRHGRYSFTSDYVVDETATLLKRRGNGRLVRPFFALLDSTEALSLVFVDEERFRNGREFFLKHDDHGYSFTDCTTFLLMKELGALEALTTDRHFPEAGLAALLL